MAPVRGYVPLKQNHIASLRCPACYSALSLQGGTVFQGDILESGELACQGCGRVYPVREGAAYLAVLDDAWGTILKELINRREIIEHELRQPANDTPTDARKAEQDQVVSTLAEVCFEEAAARIPEDRPLRLLDCGAGMFETSAWFAERGIDVVATETEISMVRYANFEGEGRGDPQPFEINGRKYHIRDPKGHPAYFTRVVSDIQRLPFADGSFDVAFCRAMLHHVDRLGDAIREMARVVRPGGKLIICAEPSRSILDRECDYHVGTIDREEGMNEQAPALSEYRRPLKQIGSEVSIQYWIFDQVGRARRFFDRLPYNYFRHLWSGEEVRGWKWVKLLPVSAGLNLYTIRNDCPVSVPGRPADDLPTIAQIIDLYIRFDGEKSIEGLDRGTEDLKAIRRALLARQPERFPASIELSGEHGLLLESGWSPVASLNGVPFRYTLHRASVILSNGGAAFLEIEHCGGREGFLYRYTVYLNGIEAAHFDGQGTAWQAERIALPSETFGGDNTHLVQIEIVNHRLNSDAELRSSVGVAIRRLALVS